MTENNSKQSTIQNIGYLLKRIASYDKKLIMYMIVAGIAEMILPLATLGLTAVLLDTFSRGQSLPYLLSRFAILLVVILGSTVLSKCFINLLNNKGNDFRVSLFIELGTKLTKVDYSLFDGSKGQETINKGLDSVMNPYYGIQRFFMVGESFVKNVLGLILYGTILGSIHFAFVIVILISSIANFLYGLYVNIKEDQYKEKLAPLNQKLRYFNDKSTEFKATKDMRLYKMSHWFGHVFKVVIEEKQLNLFKLDRIKFSGDIISAIGSLIVDLSAYIYLINLLSDGQIGIAEFTIYFGSIATLSQWVNGVFRSAVEFHKVGLAVEDFNRLMHIKSKLNHGEGLDSSTEIGKQLSIEFRNLFYRYSEADEDTFKNFNLKIASGEKVALVGINGAGKTTLVKLLSGLYLPDQGEIWINDRKMTDYEIEEYYRLFSVVFQDYFELPLTLEETILQGQTKDPRRLEEVMRLSGMDQVIQGLKDKEKSKLVKRIHEDAVDLSGGQKQKLQLAKALYKDGPILILDEPTAALDPIAENEIYKQYEALSNGKTSIFISHRLSSTRFCDRILFMENGEIVEEGSHSQLMKQRGKYFEMFETQSHYYKKKVGEVSHEAI
ncbi:ABC transporter ATP-binding protein [Marinilactibacillus sp. Marseille-P9653]|uniref:ABC transporter ATP-binding protein n=1 Tax=Marinilactibacillus sp. Marseille-P9653 TaxID=2866583 RepID=UPI001CE3F134|nr:ABC transporter ATP-binding protein [Marinilactibacillus sp. Marseille-P9653]